MQEEEEQTRGPTVYHHWTVQQTLDFLRSGNFMPSTSRDHRDFESGQSDDSPLYWENLPVVDEKERHLGYLPLCLLICAAPSTLIVTILPRQKSSGHLVIDIDTDDNEGAARTWSEYSNTDLDSFHDDTSSSSSPSCPSSPAPASPSLQAKNLKKLHNKNKPKGKHVLRHASTTSSQGSPYFLPVMTVVKKRIGWLMLLFLAETFTGSVLRMFESELSQVVALSFFVPLLIGTGGNSGSQVVTTVVRALATRKITTRTTDMVKVVVHESMISFILGSTLGIVGFVRALIWGTSTMVATVVGLTLPLIVMWANTVGSVVPMVVVLLGQDPAVVSAPFITTVVDATGLAIYFTLAKFVLDI